MTFRTLCSSLSTPMTEWPMRARHAAVTQPTYPKPNTATRSGDCGEARFTPSVSHGAHAGSARRRASACHVGPRPRLLPGPVVDVLPLLLAFNDSYRGVDGEVFEALLQAARPPDLHRLH